MEKEYWENYYKSKSITSQPSLFAKFVLKNHIRSQSSLIEFGCGNGRDAKFFAENSINVLAVDQCEKEISYLAQENNHNNLKFNCDDFTSLNCIDSFDNIYSRFTLHSIKEKEEDAVIEWAHEHLNLGGKLLIEARGQKNELFKLGVPVLGEPNAYIFEDHFRRFINMGEFCKKLEAVGFEIILAEEKSGFAPFKDTDYIFIRIIAVKK